MKTMSLHEFLEDKSQSEAALAIGVTPGAVWQMIRSDRHIEVTVHGDGTAEANEIKPIGRKKAAA